VYAVFGQQRSSVSGNLHGILSRRTQFIGFEASFPAAAPFNKTFI